MLSPVSATSPEHAAVARFCANARFYAPEVVKDLLRDVAAAPDLALIVDIDPLERSVLARIDRVMWLALDALAQSGVQIVIVSRHGDERAARLHREIARSWWFTHDGWHAVLGRVRARIPNTRAICIGDERALLDVVHGHDRGIAVGGVSEVTCTNVAAANEASVRAALWWLVDARTRARTPK